MIGVLGAGAWGTALAQMLASDGSEVTLWAREAEVVESVKATHENRAFLPGIALSPQIRATSDLAELGEATLLLGVVPAQHMARVVADLPNRAMPILLCSKGMEQGSARLMTDVLADAGWSGTIAVLSGPTFAHEVANGLPGAATLAAPTLAEAEQLAQRVARATFRPYASDDPIGAEIGGVVKNVLAIACGIVDGAQLGQNARAALIARGFAEMTRYGLARGGRIETLSGLAGLGDLVLTCSSTASRNFSFGRALAEGVSPAGLLADRRTVAEGALSAGVLADDARGRSVAMPIVEAVAAILDGRAGVDEAIAALLSRPLASEGWARR